MKKNKNLTFSRRKLIIGSSISLISSQLLTPALFFSNSDTVELQLGLASYFNNSFFKKIALGLAATFNNKSASVQVSFTDDLAKADLILASPSMHFGLSPRMAFISRSPGGLPRCDLIKWLQDPLAKEIWNREYNRFNVKPFFVSLGESLHLQPFSLPYLFSKKDSTFYVGGQYKTNPHFVSLQIQPVKLSQSYREAREKLLCSKIITSSSIRELLAEKYFKSENILLKTDGLNHSPQVFQISFNLNKWNNLNSRQKDDFEFFLNQFANKNKEVFEQKQTKIAYLEKTSFAEEISKVEKELELHQAKSDIHYLNSTLASLDQYINFRYIEQSISNTYLPLLAKHHNLNDILARYELYRSSISSQNTTRLG